MTAPKIERKSILAGWIIVAGIVVAIASLSVGTTLTTTLYGVPVALSFLLSAIVAVSVPAAILRPLLAGTASAVGVTALAVAQASVDQAPWPWAVVTIVTHSIVLVVVGLQGAPKVAVASWASAVAGTVVVAILMPRATDAPAINVIIATSVTGVAVAGGIVWREWRSIRAQLIRERTASAAEHEKRVLAEEKTRIARELHDVVAHSMSIINVQASSAAYRHTNVPAEIAQEFDEIAESARGAISELRAVLGVLREEGAPPVLAPQPGLGDIPTLVDSTAKSGVGVTLSLDESLTEEAVGEAGGLAAYRVVQEAISNAIRHAPGTDIRVSVAQHGPAVTVSVVNGPGPTIDSAGGGHGIVGMRERIAAVGGELSTGPAEGGGFSVAARIPLRKAPQ